MSANRKQHHIIKEVKPGSIAEELELTPGDELLKINDTELEDIFDYHYLTEDEYLEVLIKKPDGEEWLLEIDKDEDEDLGIIFENGLMDEYRSCCNKCIFCFIDQMP
ncbi:MAG TPA: radical SAM protein, partial [Lachnospiraceae bacterium]|nr:radical SAM protein [Lachnospiraceae bacterium]